MKMKGCIYIILTATTLLLIGCTKKEWTADAGRTGKEIVFSASTLWSNDTGTRTEYSGRDEDNEFITADSDYERIDWVDGMDHIRILCDAATGKSLPGKKTADYVVSGVSIGSEKQKSETGIVSCDDNSLQWGTGMHYFYALYPAPGTESNYAFTDYQTVTESGATISSVTGNKAVITGSVPSIQQVVRSGDIYKPNMNYAYMYAAAKVNPGETSSVLLSFKPLVTTLEFNLTNQLNDAVTTSLTRLELSSSSTPLTGSFSATVDGTGTAPSVSYTLPAYSADNSKITMALPAGVLLTDTPLKFTFLTLPTDQTDLTLTLYFGDSVKRSIKLKTAGGAVTVDACKKVYFNFGVPDSVYYIDAQGPVIMQGDELLKGGVRTITVSSYANQTNSSARPVSWKVYASTDGGENYFLPAQSGWPSWLTLSAYSGLGSVSAASLAAWVSYNPLVTGEVSDVATSGNGANMISALRSAAPVTGPRDLSLYNIYGELHSASTAPAGITKSGSHTANTYVVSAPGTYCFPIVYGNAIDMTHGDANGVYAAAYGGDWGTSKSIFNASNDNIGGPYILSDPTLEKSGSYQPVIVWQDVQKGWEMLNDIDLSIIDAPSGAGVPGCKYIRFYLDPARILPGNFVIALRDVVLNRILWSWHIWVTAVPHGAASDDFSIRTFKYRSEIYWPEGGDVNGVPTGNNPPAGSELRDTYMLNCNLGWTPPLQYTAGSTAARAALLKFVQDEGTPQAKYAIVEVRQDAVTTEPYTGVYYSNTYYQWGRKDPFLPQKGGYLGAANKSHSDGETFPGAIVSGVAIVHPEDITQTPALFIRNPHVFDSNPEGGSNNGMNYLWNSLFRDNVMDASDLAETVVAKTVNDPSPAGFTVPFGYAFTGFTRDGYHRDSPANPSTPTHYLDFFGSEVPSDPGTGHPAGFMMTETGYQNPADYTLYFAYTGHRVNGGCGNAENQTYIWTCCTKPGMSIRGQCFGSHHNIFPLFDAYHRMHGFSVRPFVEQ